MALHGNNTVTVDLPGGGTVELRLSLRVQACCLRLIQQGKDELGEMDEGMAANTALTMFVAENLDQLVAAGAIVTWSGVLDENGKPFPYHARAVDRLDVADAVTVVGGIISNLDLRAFAEMTAEQMGLDPTDEEPGIASGSD